MDDDDLRARIQRAAESISVTAPDARAESVFLNRQRRRRRVTGTAGVALGAVGLVTVVVALLPGKATTVRILPAAPPTVTSLAPAPAVPTTAILLPVIVPGTLMPAPSPAHLTAPPTTLRATTTVPPSTAVPGIVADCTAAPPQGNQPSVRPTSITLACADNGLGVQNLVWTDWTGTGASGTGKVWEKLCKPNCAQGGIGYYPAAITLSVVKTTTAGAVFTQLTAVYSGLTPNGNTIDHFSVPLP